MAEIDSGITLYDINKKAMEQEKPLDPIEFNSVTRKTIDEAFDIAKSKGHTFWMLLNKERSDYTVFVMLTKEGTLNEFRPTIQNRGLLLDISETEEGIFEVWIRDPETNENFMYYFFDYNYGIIQA